MPNYGRIRPLEFENEVRIATPGYKAEDEAKVEVQRVAPLYVTLRSIMET